MKSETSLIARNCRLQEWATQIKECQNRLPATSVKEWCKQHDLSALNYYYRFRKVRMACLQSIPAKAITQNTISVPSNLLNDSMNRSYQRFSLGMRRINLKEYIL